jgi:hypothetical protein
MLYRFEPHEFNNIRGIIAEWLVRFYINHVTIPKLKENFDFVFMDVSRKDSIPLHHIEKRLLNEKLNGTCTPKVSKEDPLYIYFENARVHVPRGMLNKFLWRGVFPTPDLYEKTIKLLVLLDVTPDGIIYKLKRTGTDLSSFDFKKAFSRWDPEMFEGLIMRRSFPIVSGEIEVIEVKANKSYFTYDELMNYGEIIRNGYTIRYFKVNIISLDKNEFAIYEKVISSLDELRKRPKIS